MHFTREPIIETIVTAKSGCKLVIRNSKTAGQEEYFVDAVEVVSFGNAFFFRSLERPKSFLVPVSDYEVMEVRETRMVLKHVSAGRSIKIAGGRGKGRKEGAAETAERAEESEEAKPEKKRRRPRRRRGREERETPQEGEESSSEEVFAEAQGGAEGEASSEKAPRKPVSLGKMLPPPSSLISESVERYREDPMFKQAFTDESKEAEASATTEITPEATEEAEHDAGFWGPFKRGDEKTDTLSEVALEAETPEAEEAAGAEEPAAEEAHVPEESPEERS